MEGWMDANLFLIYQRYSKEIGYSSVQCAVHSSPPNQGQK